MRFSKYLNLFIYFDIDSYMRFFLFCSTNVSIAIVSANINFILIFNGTNFKDWKDNVLIVLGCMDLDLALRIDRPPPLTMESSTESKKKFEIWDRSNCMSLMIIKLAILETFKIVVSKELTTAKEFLNDIEKCFMENDKTETSTLLGSLVSMKYKGQGNIREYFIQMSNIASKLKVLKL